MAAVLTFGQPILDQAGAFGLCLAFILSIAVLIFAAIGWARVIPTAISLVLGIVAWGGVAFLRRRL